MWMVMIAALLMTSTAYAQSGSCFTRPGFTQCLDNSGRGSTMFSRGGVTLYEDDNGTTGTVFNNGAGTSIYDFQRNGRPVDPPIVVVPDMPAFEPTTIQPMQPMLPIQPGS